MENVENTELRAYFDKFDDFPYLPIMARYDDDTYQYLLSMAILRGKPLTQEEVEEAYNGKVDLVEENEEDNLEEEREDANVDTNMDDKAQEKIRVLLKRYGADGKEIENFMRDLLEFKEADEEDEIKEDEGKDFNYLDEETMAKLRATEEGKDLIMNAPKMAKDELEKAIKEYLSK